MRLFAKPFHTQRWAGWFLLLGGLVMAAGGCWYITEAYAFLEQTRRAEGAVVALTRRSSARGFDLDHPVVRYVHPESGKAVEFTSRFGMRPSPFAVSDRVDVAYDPAMPARARINSFWTLWLLPLLLVVFGLACVVAGRHTLGRTGAGGASPPGNSS